MAAAADELLLLERVFLRVGSADTDEQLQNAVSKFLPPVLLKLSSQQEGVRKKVMELLVHINKRIKSRPLVQLPVEALLLQYQDPAASSFVTNFTIIYIKLGFPRLSLEKQAELVPSVLNALEAKPQSHQDSLLMLIIPLLGQVSVPTDPDKRSSLFGLNEKPHVAKQLASLMLDMLLLPYGSTAQSPTSSEPGSSSAPQFPTPPGMSPYSYRRVTGGSATPGEAPGAPLRPDQLEQVKLGIVRFLAGGVYVDSDILVHLVVAAADTRFSVANLADLELKKVVGGLDWSSASLATPLYRLFLGSQGNVKPENKKTPASTRIRLKLLHYLCRVTGNGFIIPPCVQVVFDSLYGVNTNTKLKSLALTFTTNIIQHADINSLEPVGRLLLCGLTKLTEEGESIHQGQAYCILGLLGRRLPELFANDLGLLENLFKKLSTENPDVKLQIREGMLNLVAAYMFKQVDQSKMLLLYSLLCQYVDVEEPMVRFVATRFIATVFPANHIQSRYLLLLATGDSKDDICAEAMKALYGNKLRNENIDEFSTDKSQILPDFSDFMNYIYSEANLRLLKPGKCYSQGNHLLPFAPNVFREILIYLRMCLIQDLNVPHSRDVSRHPNEHTAIIAQHLIQIYSKFDSIDKNPILQYLNLIKLLLKAQQSIEIVCCLLEIVGCVPEVHKLFLDDLKPIRDLLNSTKEEIREYGAVLYGIIIAYGFSGPDFDAEMKNLLKQTANMKYLETIHGCILAIANSIERRIVSKQPVYGCQGDETVPQNAVKLICNFVTNSSQMLISAACISVGLLGKCSELPLSNVSTDEDNSPCANKMALVKSLFVAMKNNKLSSKVRERAARSLGLICVGEIFPHAQYITEELLNTAKESKDVEMHFTIGDSLVMAVTSTQHPEARDPWAPKQQQENAMEVDPPQENNLLLVVLEQTIKLIQQPHPNSRQAGAIWLLSLLKCCSDREAIQTRLVDIQAAFMDLLSDNNDIVVDVASKGLGLVFETSGTDLSSALLEQLVDQLQSGRKTVPTVTKDTKLFEEGELGKSPTGGNLSTYKELCSLASDLNKPDLIYKFMQLANHNTIWNSKKGAAFGFLSIAASAGEQLKPHLPKIIPRLYRYQFDPTPNLQNSMQRIWKVLVPETQKTIDLYHQEILRDLVDNLTAGQWRVRLSCCLALADLFRSGGVKSAHESIHTWPELWRSLFRVMDDVHESTRSQACNTANVLSKLCIRACDVNYGKDGSLMVQAILPVFLEVGIVNTVAEVRAVSLQTVSSLVGSSGPQLAPFLHLLIPALLQATGELESSKLSYISTMFGANTETQEVIDSVRASAARTHYTTETMTRCLQYVTESHLEALIPPILDLMRSNSSLGTRVACAHFLTLLQRQLPSALEPFAPRCLKLLLDGVKDRNSAVRKYYSSTIGHIIGSAKPPTVLKILNKLEHWYKVSDDESIRLACALTFQSICNHNQELLKAHATTTIPFILLAMHADVSPDSSPTVDIWRDVWGDVTPGMETALRQYIGPVCEAGKKGLESASWRMKAQAASMISTVAEKLGTSLEVEHRNVLIEILIEGLGGRVYTGKEKLLKALATICTSCKKTLINDPEVDVNRIIAAVMKECRKEDIFYKGLALQSLGDILNALEVDKFEDLYNIVESILAKDTAAIETDEDLSADETLKKRENSIKLRETIYETLGKAWPDNIQTQEKYSQLFVEHCLSCLPATTRDIQVFVMSALCCFVDKLAIFTGNSSENLEKLFPNILENILQAVSYALQIPKHTRLRKEALNIIISFAKNLKDKGRDDDFGKLKLKFNEMLPHIEKDNAPEIKSRVLDLKDVFKS